MSLTISLTNTGDTDQLITLFDNGGSASSTFVNTNGAVTPSINQTIQLSTSIPTLQDVQVSDKTYYNVLFNPNTNLSLSGFGNGITVNIFYLNTFYTISVTITSGLTLNQVNALVTNAIRNNIYYPRPQANFILSLESIGGINYIRPNIFDENVDTSIFYYTDIGIASTNATYITNYYYDQVITDNQNSSAIQLSTYPNTSLSNDGWHIIQCNGLTSASDFVDISFFDTYLFTAYSGDLQVQLTQTLAQNFDLFDGFSTQTILGSTTSIQTFTILNATAIKFSLSGISASYSGQIKVRLYPNLASTVSTAIYLGLSISINSYLVGNPNVIAKSSSTGVGLVEILNSVIGNSYKVTSLYIWSANPNQLIQNITYGTIDANGNIAETSLDVVIDPFAQNQVAYRTNGMDNFIIDSNAIIQFTLLANSSVNMKFEYDKVGFDEIKLIDMGLGDLLQIQQAEKELLDMQLGTPGADSDFTDFYATQ